MCSLRWHVAAISRVFHISPTAQPRSERRQRKQFEPRLLRALVLTKQRRERVLGVCVTEKFIR